MAAAASRDTLCTFAALAFEDERLRVSAEYLISHGSTQQRGDDMLYGCLLSKVGECPHTPSTPCWCAGKQGRF